MRLYEYIVISVNPYKEKIDDEVVAEMFKNYHDLYDPIGDMAGLPDKFVVECVQAYLWQQGMTIKPVINGHLFGRVLAKGGGKHILWVYKYRH